MNNTGIQKILITVDGQLTDSHVNNVDPVMSYTIIIISRCQ